MKCNECDQSYIRLDESCSWHARCNLLGTSYHICECIRENMCGEDTDCNDQEAPDWDCDLGQDNRYCKHYQADILRR